MSAMRSGVQAAMDHEHRRRPDLSHERLGTDEARGPDEPAGDDV